MSLIWPEIENTSFMSNKINKAGIDLIKRWESFRAKPYLCPAAIPTIGYGTTVYPSTGRKVLISDPPISEENATFMLMAYLDKYVHPELNRLIKVPLNENQYSALCSFVYNIGMTAFRMSTILRLINSKTATPEQIRAQFMRWNKAGGRVLPGLTNRRQSEADLYFKP